MSSLKMLLLSIKRMSGSRRENESFGRLSGKKIIDLKNALKSGFLGKMPSQRIK
jgi:hypothetical protein